jgi:hypothetical protein
MEHDSTQIIAQATTLEGLVERFTSRKFLLTVFVQGVGAVGFLTRVMDAGTYVALSTLVLSSYGAASIVDKHLNE